MSGVVIAFFFFTIFGTYAYAFYMGSVWIEKDFYNPLYDRPYSSGGTQLFLWDYLWNDVDGNGNP